MIYIATIHWRTDRWIDIQKKYLNKHINEEFRIFAFLEGIEEQYKSRYYYSINRSLKDHGVKLNILSDAILEDSNSDDDILVFLDGDAFPISDLIPYIHSKLKGSPLLAMKREENLGDVIAHPAFCVTTIRFWKEIKGNWEKGFQYKNNLGRIVADVGGYLYNNLSQNDIQWYPLLRSNKQNLHPLFFGIYDNIIYHHGAGFRDPVSSIDLFEENYFSPFNQIILSVYHRISAQLSEKNKRRFDPLKWKRRKIKKRNFPIERKVFSMILNNEKFYSKFLDDHA